MEPGPQWAHSRLVTTSTCSLCPPPRQAGLLAVPQVFHLREGSHSPPLTSLHTLKESKPSALPASVSPMPTCLSSPLRMGIWPLLLSHACSRETNSADTASVTPPRLFPSLPNQELPEIQSPQGSRAGVRGGGGALYCFPVGRQMAFRTESIWNGGG